MTVSQLIEMLKKAPQDSTVLLFPAHDPDVNEILVSEEVDELSGDIIPLVTLTDSVEALLSFYDISDEEVKEIIKE